MKLLNNITIKISNNLYMEIIDQISINKVNSFAIINRKFRFPNN